MNNGGGTQRRGVLDANFPDWSLPATVIVLGLLLIGAATACEDNPPEVTPPTVAPSPTATASPTPDPTATPTPTEAAAPSPTAIASPTPDSTATATPTPTQIATPIPTATASPTPDPTATATPTQTATPIPTATAKPTPTQIATPTPTMEEAEAAVQALPWVEDGLTVDEQETVIQLLYMASESRVVLWELVHRRWMQDELSRLELQVIFLLTSIVSVDQMSAEQIVVMPFLDSIEGEDLTILQTLEAFDGEGLRWLLSHPALTGRSAHVLPAALALLLLEWEWPEGAAATMALPWISDGIDPSEVRAVLQLQELALESPRVFRALVPRPWVQDGLDPDETTIVAELSVISGRSFARRDESTALRIVAMPFLETVDGVDAAAVSSLRSLFWASDVEDYLMQVLAHPSLEDGISDDEAFVVAALEIVVKERPDLLDTLLDLGSDAVEKRIIRLPLVGEVTLSVLNVNPGSYSTLDQLERILRAQEAFMDVPFPRSYVGLLVADATSAGGGGGPSGLLTVDPGYVEDEYIIGHELAHTYWPFFPAWIAEGGADFMTTVSANKQFSSQDCSLGDTLSDLDRLYEELSESGQPTGIIRSSGCAYSLGRGLFLDLYETLGDEAFRRGFRRLYLAMRDGEMDGECTGVERGVCYVRAAFVDSPMPDPASPAEAVIDRWYHGPRR